MSDEVALAEDNYLATWRLLASGAVGGAVVETDDLLFTCAPVPVPYFNNAFVKPRVDPASCIDVVKTFFVDRGTPFTIRFRNDAVFQPDDALESAGLVPTGSSPLMIADSAGIGAVGDCDVRQVDAGSWHAHVSTPEAYRGRGFGGATTRAAVAEGLRRGCTRTTLQASEMGYPLYAEMGYRTVTQWRNFTGG